MKFKSSNKLLFFWMQENDTEKDEKLWKKVNDFLNNPPTPGSTSTSATSGTADRGTAGSAANASSLANVLGADFAGLEGHDLQNLMMSDQHLQMFLGGFMNPNSPSSNRSSSSLSSGTSRVQSTQPGSRADTISNLVPTTPAASESTAHMPSTEELTKAPSKAARPDTDFSSSSTGATATPNGAASNGGGTKMQFTDFKNILGNIAQSGGANGAAASRTSELDLSEILSLDTMAPILANKSIQEKLIKFLPDAEILPKNEAELKKHLTTPQFKKAMSSFGSALQSGQLGTLMTQFNLPEQVSLAAAQGNLEAFAKAMEQHAQEKKLKEAQKKTGEEDAMDTK
jgi:hypothetical protein